MSRPREDEAIFWTTECYRVSLSEISLRKQSVTEYLSQKSLSENEEFFRVFLAGFCLCFQASASASVYKDHDKEADTRSVDHVHRRVSGAPFDGTPLYGLGTPFDGTPFEN